MGGYLLGIDIGSSSVKVSCIEIESGKILGSSSSPEVEMSITARKDGWAEQHPDLWWNHCKLCCAAIEDKHPGLLKEVEAVGIAYQMHGLVMIDKNGAPLRDAIIWCDSRAVPYGNRAFTALGEEKCFSHLLNSPGNFTAAKLAWVKENEPEIFGKIWKIMLPGEYISFRMTGEVVTSPSGLSEGIFWDALNERPADFLLNYYGIDPHCLGKVIPTFSEKGRISREIADELGLTAGISVSYLAGDQPNNAFSLGVLKPGEAATTAGTSGVVYGVTDLPLFDSQSRVNSFVHVNHSEAKKRYGILLCLNGTGSLNQWLKRLLNTAGAEIDYPKMNELAAATTAGAEGLQVFPFGNGAERILQNRQPGAMVRNLNFNIHNASHLLRAAQEGIVFALCYGIEIMSTMGVEVKNVKAGSANMFLSPLFRECFASVSGTTVELFNTDGSIGAARGAGIGARIYSSPEEAFVNLQKKFIVEPDSTKRREWREVYESWKVQLEGMLQ